MQHTHATLAPTYDRRRSNDRRQRGARAPICAALLGCVLLSAAPAQAPVYEIGTLVPPGALANDNLGDVLALDTDWLVAGLPFRSTSQGSAGVVALWPRTATGFGAPVVLQAPTTTFQGSFGQDVALDGDDLCIAERSSLHFGSPARGAVHRYRHTLGAWTHLDSIANPSSVTGNRFGRSCAKDGDLIVVGAPSEQVQFVPVGAAYVFRFVNGQWIQEAMLVASDGFNGDEFGADVALSGERIVVGAPLKWAGSLQAGAAYAFERVGGVWTETARFAVDAGTNDRWFGVSVDVDGATAVVGAARTNDRGSAYVFVDNGAAWQRESRLQPQNLNTFATFGHACDLRGDELVIGAWQDSAAGHLTGSAWVFQRSAGTWSPTVRLVSSLPLSAAHGRGVALDGAGSFVVGEPVRTIAGSPGASGAAHYYRPERLLGSTYCTPLPNSTGRIGGIAATGSELVAADDVTLTAYDLPTSSFGFFLASRTQGVVHQPGGSVGVLCLGGAIGRYVSPGQIRNTGIAGLFSLSLDLTATPTPTGLVSIAAGETWNFQTWHRDQVAGVARSNFTGAVSVGFL